LDKAAARAHILEGLIRAVNVIDDIIALVRGSDDRNEAKGKLMAEPFDFSEEQANFILDMRLGQLTRLARVELVSELDEKRALMAELTEILENETKLRQVIKDEMSAVRQKFASPRRAEIMLDTGEMSIEDLVDDKELVVVMTRANYIKTIDAGAFRTQGRGGRGVSGARLKDEDLVAHVIHTTAHAYLLLFSNRGRVYKLRAHEIPERERQAKGTPVVNLLPIQAGETIEAIIDTRDFDSGGHLFFATKKGQVKKTELSEYDSSRRDGLIAINLKDGDELVKVIRTSGGDDVLMVTRKGITIRFSEEEVRAMGRAAAGVIGMKMRSGRRGGQLRCRPRGRRHVDRHRQRLRQAHPAGAVQPAGPRRAGRHRHATHRQARLRRGRLHGGPRRRDHGRVLRRRRDAHGRAGDLVPGT
jgi:DNA gyrase subunit A